MRRSLASVAALSCLVLVSGCGQDDASGTSKATSSATPSPSGGGSSSAGAQQIKVTFRGDSVTPSGERVEVAAGKPVELVVTADTAGELHVHSSPEQELAYDAGTTTLELTIDQPGVVDVESHDLGKTIVQLEVR
jgi:hypothetical protein